MSAKKTNVSENQNSGSLASGSPSERYEDRTGSPDQSKPAMSGGLYLVATPIGNARDITLRALDILTAADVIACEDTRVTAKLLSIHGVAAQKTISYHEHNAEKVRPHLMERLKSGEIVAVVSDAGTPLINDPGFRLVGACRENHIPVHAAPGASAVTTALVLAGLPTDRFMYCGFPPPKSGKRRTWFGGVSTIPSTLVFLESPKRLAASLADMSEIFGDRPAAVCREMTKKFEETRTGSLAELAAHYADVDAPRGEITVVVGPSSEETTLDASEVEDRLREALQIESVREASSRIAAETGLPRRDIYSLALKLKDEDGADA